MRGCILGVKGAHPVTQAYQRFAQFPRAQGRAGRGQRLRIEQHGAQHRLHVAAHASAIVGKRGCYPAHIGGAGIAGDEPLDQLAAEEGPRVRVVEQGVKGLRQVGFAGGGA
ncbi:hypothetical protein D3C72_1303120 [compost metagenome]